MAVQTIKKGQTLTLTATEDELILVGAWKLLQPEVRFINISGTSKFSIGGPTSDTTLSSYTTAGTVVTLSLDFIKQADPDPSNSIHRVHCSGVGTWKVEW